MSFTVLLLAADAAQITVTSPDGRNTIQIARDGGTYSVSRGGELVVAPSPLGLDLAAADPLGPLTLEARRDDKVDRRVPLIADKAAVARDRYNGARLTFRETGAGGRA